MDLACGIPPSVIDLSFAAVIVALRATYGFAPTVFTTCPPDAPLTNGIAFCRVRSWLTGSRLVSLPFSDHCEPLVDDAAALKTLLAAVREKAMTMFKYAEIRPRSRDLQGA